MMTPWGNATAQAKFAAAIDRGALHHAWLFTGPEGVGKASFARAAAHRLLATPDERDPAAGPFAVREEAISARLIAAGSHADYRELRRLPKDPEKPDQDVARSIAIAQVRALGPMLMTRPAAGTHRVIVIDSVDDLERPGASNALLKNLEEPPDRTIFLLVSHAPGRLLPTIRSRCRTLRFEPLDDVTMMAALRRLRPDMADDEVAALTGVATGSPGRALRYAGLDLAGIDRALTVLSRDGDREARIGTGLAKALGTKAAQPRYEAFLDRVPSFLARVAQDRLGSALRHTLDAYEQSGRIAAAARALSLDQAGTVLELAGVVARARRAEGAK